jgi:hypothetical protein
LQEGLKQRRGVILKTEAPFVFESLRFPPIMPTRLLVEIEVRVFC